VQDRVSDNAFAIELFSGLPKRYDALAEVLSFGQNAQWRRELVSRLSTHHPNTILDVATGTAGVAIALAAATEARIAGVDISDAMLARGRQRVQRAGLAGRITLEPARAEALPYQPGSFDAVSFTYLLRYIADPETTLAGLARVIRPGGHMASLDFYVPPNVGWRGAWRGYTRTLLPAAGLLFGGRSWWDVGRFLGPNIEGFYARWPLARLVAAWKAAGMVDVGWRVMSLGGGLVMWGTKGDA
jgi:demethylmenaquinone methyltransferase / 2-methoxy-6-polyprenyl-1,4-benzoquinol methylase